MGTFRLPGPLCTTLNAPQIDSGTLCLHTSAKPGPIGTGTLHSTAIRQEHAPKKHAVLRTSCPKPGPLGTLSAHYESGGRGDSAIGWDSTGGWSYGKYQIATKTGTMGSFLEFLKTHAPAASVALELAGGSQAATAGAAPFKQAWVALASDAGFAVLQHDFIAERNYAPLVLKIKFDTGLDVSARSAAVRDVVWSIAVQHGPGSAIVSRALAHHITTSMGDLAIIDAIYDERGAERLGKDGHWVLKYFSKSSPAVQNSVRQRYQRERYCAKQMITNFLP